MRGGTRRGRCRADRRAHARGGRPAPDGQGDGGRAGPICSGGARSSSAATAPTRRRARRSALLGGRPGPSSPGRGRAAHHPAPASTAPRCLRASPPPRRRSRPERRRCATSRSSPACSAPTPQADSPPTSGQPRKPNSPPGSPIAALVSCRPAAPSSSTPSTPTARSPTIALGSRPTSSTSPATRTAPAQPQGPLRRRRRLRHDRHLINAHARPAPVRITARPPCVRAELWRDLRPRPRPRRRACVRWPPPAGERARAHGRAGEPGPRGRTRLRRHTQLGELAHAVL